MNITIDMIKQLREATAAGMGACKEALKATDGNMDEAVKYLREKGLAVAAKRVDKESKQGIVALAEAADKKTMALAEVNCETDFVAKTESFRNFCHDLAIHICGCNPLIVRREQLYPAVLADRQRLILEQALEENKNAKSSKPEKIIEEKIVPGRVDKWLSEITLLDQHWMGDNAEPTVEMKRAELSMTTGENIQIARFTRLAVGEGAEATEGNEGEE